LGGGRQGDFKLTLRVHGFECGPTRAHPEWSRGQTAPELRGPGRLRTRLKSNPSCWTGYLSCTLHFGLFLRRQAFLAGRRVATSTVPIGLSFNALGAEIVALYEARTRLQATLGVPLSDLTLTFKRDNLHCVERWVHSILRVANSERCYQKQVGGKVAAFAGGDWV